MGVGGGGAKARQTVKEGNNDLIRLSSITGWGVALGGAEGVYPALSTCYYLFHKSCDLKKGGGGDTWQEISIWNHYFKKSTARKRDNPSLRSTG